MSKLRSVVLVAVTIPAVALPGAGLAQGVSGLERHLPPVVTAPHTTLTPEPAASSSSADATSFGIRLKGVRLFGLEGSVAAHPAGGVNLEGIDSVSADKVDAALTPFIGQPLSPKSIDEIRAAVVGVYRAAGRPFVSVTTPPQEITSGVLQLQVIPYRLGSVRARAETAPADAGDFTGRLRTAPGQLIETHDLAEDLDWLNRFPYRHITGVFEPGSDTGLTDLTLTITREKPWRVFGGYTNSGNKETGYDRYFLGFAAGIEALNDLTLSYQLTGGENFWTKPSSIRLTGSDRPEYISHAGRIAIPTLARQSIEIAPNFVATTQTTADGILTFRNTTFELPVLYRIALSNLWGKTAPQSDLYIGPAFKWMNRDTLWDSIRLAHGHAAALNLILGWNGFRQETGGAVNSWDLRIVGNPGGVLAGNTDRAWEQYTNGRVDSARYVYGLVQFDRTLPLDAIPALKGFSVSTGFTGLLAGQALPDSEQLSLGGLLATRGYTSGDGAVDAGFVLRNELHLPAFALLGGGTAASSVQLADKLDPFLFLDLAYGHNYNFDISPASFSSDKADTTLVSVGAGFNYSINSNFNATLTAGWALKDARRTERGDLAVQARVSISY